MTNGKRVFVAALCIGGCVFFNMVFAGRTGFTSVQGTYNAAVEVSDINFAGLEPDAAGNEELSDGEALLPLTSLKSDNAVAMVSDITPAELELVTVGHEELSDGEAFLSLEALLSEYEDEEVETNAPDDPPSNQEDEEPDHVEEEIVLYEEKLDFDSSDWRLVLINKQHPIPEEYEFKLGNFSSGMRCDERVIEDLLLMMQAAKKEGLNLVVRSPYRTTDHQEDNFNSRIKSYMRQGLSYMEAYKVTSKVITIPGCSEHEVGLALDITSDTYMLLLQGFADTEEGQWLEEHGHEYGFILRYPSGKEYITGIEFEPWHFRYVGREAAAIMKEENLCLEEFWEKYL